MMKRKRKSPKERDARTKRRMEYPDTVHTPAPSASADPQMSLKSAFEKPQPILSFAQHQSEKKQQALARSSSMNNGSVYTPESAASFYHYYWQIGNDLMPDELEQQSTRSTRRTKKDASNLRKQIQRQNLLQEIDPIKLVPQTLLEAHQIQQLDVVEKIVGRHFDNWLTRLKLGSPSFLQELKMVISVHYPSSEVSIFDNLLITFLLAMPEVSPLLFSELLERLVLSQGEIPLRKQQICQVFAESLRHVQFQEPANDLFRTKTYNISCSILLRQLFERNDLLVSEREFSFNYWIKECLRICQCREFRRFLLQKLLKFKDLKDPWHIEHGKHQILGIVEEERMDIESGNADNFWVTSEVVELLLYHSLVFQISVLEDYSPVFLTFLQSADTNTCRNLLVRLFKEINSPACKRLEKTMLEFAKILLHLVKLQKDDSSNQAISCCLVFAISSVLGTKDNETRVYIFDSLLKTWLRGDTMENQAKYARRSSRRLEMFLSDVAKLPGPDLNSMLSGWKQSWESCPLEHIADMLEFLIAYEPQRDNVFQSTFSEFVLSILAKELEALLVQADSEEACGALSRFLSEMVELLIEKNVNFSNTDLVYTIIRKAVCVLASTDSKMKTFMFKQFHDVVRRWISFIASQNTPLEADAVDLESFSAQRHLALLGSCTRLVEDKHLAQECKFFVQGFLDLSSLSPIRAILKSCNSELASSALQLLRSIVISGSSEMQHLVIERVLVDMLELRSHCSSHIQSQLWSTFNDFAKIVALAKSLVNVLLELVRKGSRTGLADRRQVIRLIKAIVVENPDSGQLVIDYCTRLSLIRTETSHENASSSPVDGISIGLETLLQELAEVKWLEQTARDRLLELCDVLLKKHKTLQGVRTHSLQSQFLESLDAEPFVAFVSKTGRHQR